ncbi:MAG: restriction endonuclease subunit S [Patescibacteria group bacterium]
MIFNNKHWRSIRLGDVCEVTPGYAFKSTDWLNDGIPVIKITNLLADRTVDLSNVDFVSESFLTSKVAKYLLIDGDILIAMTGATAGKVARFRAKKINALLNQRVARIRPKLINYDFLWAVVSSSEYQKKFYDLADGAAQPNMSGSQIENVEIPYPPAEEQKKIGLIIKNYDTLIENNTRRIAILEEMARLLYREWFVNFCFPGHEEVKMVDSPLGPIPKGWEVGRLGDFADEVRRSVSPEQVDPETPYLGLEHFPRRSIALLEWDMAKNVQSTKLMFKKGEILFGKIRPYFHKVGVAPIDGVCSTDAIVIVPKKEDLFSLVLCTVASDEFVAYATQTSQGTKMPRANWAVLADYRVVMPNDIILKRFNALIGEMVALIENLVFKTRNLRATRDLLLPRLISGEIDVSNLGNTIMSDQT